MPAPVVVRLALSCRDLKIFSAMGDPCLHIVVQDVRIGDERNAVEVGMTQPRESVCPTWADEPIVAELAFDGRRGLKFILMEGDDLIGECVVPHATLYTQGTVHATVYNNNEAVAEQGVITVEVNDDNDVYGEAWVSAVGVDSSNQQFDPAATYLAFKRSRQLLARSPSEWEEMRGELMKFSTGKSNSFFKSIKNWKSRWCVVSRARFAYFESPDAPLNKGAIQFDTTLATPPFSVIREPNPSIHKEIKDPTAPYFAMPMVENSKNITLLLKAEDKLARARWCDFVELQAKLADGAPATWPVIRAPAAFFRTHEDIELCVCEKATDTPIASAFVTTKDILESKMVELGAGGSEGNIQFHKVRRRRPMLRHFFQKGYTVQLTLAVDFTASNQDPKDPGCTTSLHHLTSATENQYIDKIRQVVSALGPFSLGMEGQQEVNDALGYDSGTMAHTVSGTQHSPMPHTVSSSSIHRQGTMRDPRMPPIDRAAEVLENVPVTCYGFGANVGAESGCFPLNRHTGDSVITGLEKIIAHYKDTANHVPFFGPRTFRSVLHRVIDEIKENTRGDRYMVLVFLTCGEPHDLKECQSIMTEYSNLPLSVVLVGVGGDVERESFKMFREMNQTLHSAPLDCEVSKTVAQRNTIRYVRCPLNAGPTVLASHPPRDFSATTSNPSSHQALDLSSTLDVIPCHILDWVRINGIELGMG
eukprot:TRINITY_DN18851_c0_g1_i1.p1 TRINITY_DN18851_c0_g1~~TRINITY_DN18851_c0_g1_i1.p1  ORF type:complete len:721 (+),score=214.15 TRINITY_DN18851_c0_g1_i1:57-2165(+)